MQIASNPLVPAEYINKASTCCKITNTRTGNVFLRNLDESARWSTLFMHCSKHPEEFFCEFDRDLPARGVKGEVIFDEHSLRSKNMPELQRIGKEYGVSERSKDGIIRLILKAQEAAQSETSE